MKTRSLHFLLAALLSTSALAAVPNDEDHPDKEAEEKQLAAFPEIPPCDIADVMQLRIVNNQFAIYSKLPNNDSPARVKINDLPGLIRINLRSSHEAKPGETREVDELFNFEKWDFSTPHCTSSVTASRTNWNLQLARVVEYSDGSMQQVSIVQTPPDLSDGDIGIRLRASESNPNVDAGAKNVEVAGTDIVALRRQHPKEVAKYLEPILLELKVEFSIFAPERKLAFQVFMDDARPLPEMSAKLAAIIAKLDADGFREREKAASELQALGESGVVALSHLDRSHLSPEQIARIDSVLAPYRTVSPEKATHLSSDANFLIDCLYGVDPFIVKSSLAHLTKLAGKPIAFDPALKDQARCTAIAHLRNMFTPTTQHTTSE